MVADRQREREQDEQQETSKHLLHSRHTMSPLVIAGAGRTSSYASVHLQTDDEHGDEREHLDNRVVSHCG